MTNQSELTHSRFDFSYEKALSLAQHKVKEALSASPGLIREYTRHLANTTGKFIRARSLLTCAQDDEGFISKNAVTLATAIEILHLATLVHDDVIDDADMRRGMVTLHKKYGSRTAVICGDYLLSIVYKLAASVSRKDEYQKHQHKKVPDFIGRICLGELNQHINSGNYNLSTYQYLKIIAGKTACMFEAAFYIGASLVEEDESMIKAYAKIGHYAGMVFQLTDDCMDFETTEHIAKKPVQSDYEQNVITLPLIHTFNQIKGLRSKAKQEWIPKVKINKLVKNAGGLVYTRNVAKKYYHKAMNIVQGLEISNDKREKVIAILKKTYRIF